MTRNAPHALIAAVTVAPPVIAYLGLGANLGDRRATLAAARNALAATPGVTLLAASPLYVSAPVGGPAGQGEYLNAVLAVATTLTAEALLTRCQTLETAHGRVRGERWGARTLDLDLLGYGECQCETAALTLPHPRLAERLFVLQPLCDVAPDWRPPGQSGTVRELLALLGNGDCRRLPSDW